MQKGYNKTLKIAKYHYKALCFFLYVTGIFPKSPKRIVFI